MASHDQWLSHDLPPHQLLNENGPWINDGYTFEPGFLENLSSGYEESSPPLDDLSEDMQWSSSNYSASPLISVPYAARPEVEFPMILDDRLDQSWNFNPGDSLDYQRHASRVKRKPPSSTASWDLESNFSADKDAERHICSECDSVFETLQGLDRHTKGSSHKAWKCEQPGCTKEYARRDSYLRHRMKHGNNSHPCLECLSRGKQNLFIRKDHLGEHIRNCHSKGSGSSGSCKASAQDWSADSECEPATLHPVVKSEGCSPKQQKAMKDVMTSLSTVLGDHDSDLIEKLSDTVTNLSGRDIQSVAVSMAGAALAKTNCSTETCVCPCAQARRSC